MFDCTPMFVDHHFRQRLSLVEDCLLTAVANGTLTTFLTSWSSLLADFSKAASQVDSTTVAIAHSVAARVLVLTDCYSDLRKKQEELSRKFRDDLDSILKSMSRLHLDDTADINESQTCQPTDTRGTPTSPKNGSLPAFIAPAYSWLLNNLHNPYPSPEIKAAIAAQSNCPITSVSAWFTSVRRRTGWTAICREHFSNRRADALDAAHRALVEEDHARPLSFEVIQAFMTMKVNAECLYSSIFTKSVLADDLDTLVKDMADVDTQCAQPQCGSLQGSHAYPSPQQSRSSSPSVSECSLSVGSGDDLVGDGNDAISAPITKNKRRLPSDLPDCDPSIGSRPIKRCRSVFYD